MGFWTGAMFGAIGGAAYGMLTAPQPGQETRSELFNRVEEKMASMTGMEIWTPDDPSTTMTHPSEPMLDAVDESSAGTT